MSGARSVLRLLLMAFAANANATALPVSDLHSATLSIETADRRSAVPPPRGFGDASSLVTTRPVAGGDPPEAPAIPAIQASSLSHDSAVPRGGSPGLFAQPAAGIAGAADNVPVPATLWMLAMGLIGSAGIGRRRSELRAR